MLNHQPLVSVWPGSDQIDRSAIGKAFVIADQRSRHGDVAFGIARLVDIAARGLSPGVNDPKTAEEVVLRLGGILVELAVRDLPPVESQIDGRTLIRNAELDHADYVQLAIEPIRRVGRDDPTVLATIARTLATATDVAQRRRPDAAVAAFRDQVVLVLHDAQMMQSDTDRAYVEDAVKSTSLV